MTFRISPVPAKKSGAYQQAVYVKRLLERGGWDLALTGHGPTPEHIPLTSMMWAIAWNLEGRATVMSYGGHEVNFCWHRNRGWDIEIDDLPTSIRITSLRLMLVDDDA